MGSQTTFEKLNLESLVHPVFLPYFREYMLLQSEEDRKSFWKTRKINEDQETLKAAWIDGMQRLAERVDDLKRRVIAAKLAEH